MAYSGKIADLFEYTYFLTTFLMASFLPSEGRKWPGGRPKEALFIFRLQIASDDDFPVLFELAFTPGCGFDAVVFEERLPAA